MKKNINDVNHAMQNNNGLNINNNKIYQNEKNTNYAIDRKLFTKKTKI